MFGQHSAESAICCLGVQYVCVDMGLSLVLAITQKKAYNIQNLVKVWNQEHLLVAQLSIINHIMSIKYFIISDTSG